MSTAAARIMHAWAAVALLCALGAQGELLTSVSQVAKSYDFVIIGGGTAGNVVANRLTEDPSCSVLVIEAGITNANQEDLIVPFLGLQATPNTAFTWNYTTTPQVGFDGRVIPYPRGRVLGGSSSVNLMVYTRGSVDDFNRYASFTGDIGWSWNKVLPLILKTEKFVQSADHHNLTGQFDPKVHNFNGPIMVSIRGFETEIDNRVIQTTQELSDEFPFNLDMNSGNMLGVGWTQSTIGDSKRSSSATGYLAPQFLARKNLDVILQTQVTKIFKTGTSSGVPEFRGVEFAQSRSGPRFNVTAKNEVILSAGSLNTPQVLMLSGIGNSTALKEFGIEPLVDLPEVGQNLSDHPLVSAQFNVTGNDTFEAAEQNVTVAIEQLVEYNTTGGGPLVNGPSNHIGWFRLPKNTTIFENTTDPSAGPGAPHYELLFSNGFATFVSAIPTTGRFMSILGAVVTPVSRGTLTLNSTDPFDFPLIDPGLLSNPVDLAIIVESLKAAKRFLTASVWKDYIIAPFGEFANSSTDAGIEQFAKDNTGSVFHPTGTASMAPKNAKSGQGVVNSDLTVKGVKGLRIVDASILPFVPAAHPQAAVYVVGERASQLIQQTWGLKHN